MSRPRSWVSALVVTLTLAGLALVGINKGYPTVRPRLSSGQAWLVSARVGQLTLLDGSSVEVAGQVQVAAAGTPLDVVQEGGSAVAVDHSLGALRRVDGATFAVSAPVTPLRGARSGLRAFAGPDVVYALDSDHGVLAEADPGTLAQRGGLVPLSARVDAQASVLDDAGRLWVIDGATGDLVWLEHDRRRVRSAAGTPGAGLLTLAGGTPVLVDTKRRTATVLDPDTGDPGRQTALDLRPDDRVQVSGAARAARLYVVTSRGVLEICDLAGAGCATAVPLNTDSGGELGAPLEAGGRVFVPDYATGRVWIVDVPSGRIVAQPRVVGANTHFQLLLRDGLVFFNDPYGDRAGVVRLDGGVSAVSKYDTANPERGLAGQPPHPSASAAPNTPAGRPNPAPSTSPVGHPRPPVPGASSSPAGRPTRSGSPSPSPFPSVTPTTPPVAPPVQIQLSTAQPTVGGAVVLKVVDRPPTTQPTPAAARWQFGDGNTGNGVTVSHTWGTAGTFLVTVTATFPDGTTSVAAVSVTVTVPTPRTGTLTLDLDTSSGPGQVHVKAGGTEFDCASSECRTDFPAGTTVTLTANPGNRSRLSGWSGGCAGAASTCDVPVPDTGAQVTARFHTVVVLNVNVSDEAGVGNYVSGPGIGRCDSNCQATFDLGDSVQLTAHKGTSTRLRFFWGGACSGSNLTCTVPMSSDQNVTADFVIICVKPPFCGPNVIGTGISASTAPRTASVRLVRLPAWRRSPRRRSGSRGPRRVPGPGA